MVEGAGWTAGLLEGGINYPADHPTADDVILGEIWSDYYKTVMSQTQSPSPPPPPPPSLVTSCQPTPSHITASELTGW